MAFHFVLVFHCPTHVLIPSRSGVAEAKYTDLAVTTEVSRPYIRRPKFNEDYRWTEVCSSSDTDCLACEPL